MPYRVQCPRWFIPELIEKLAGIGVVPTGIRESGPCVYENGEEDAPYDLRDLVILPWEIDVPRVKFVLELCDLCGHNRMQERWHGMADDESNGSSGTPPHGS